MKLAKSTWFVGLALGAIFFSPPAEANMILSVFHGAVLYMVLSLIPVIVVESIVLSVQLGLSALQAVLWAFLANCVSTVAGIPIVGGLLSNTRDLRFGWLSRAAGAVMDIVDYEEEPEEDVPEGAGLVVLFLLFFVASCLIEFGVLVFVLGATTETAEIAMATIWANVWTYGLIAAIPAVIILGAYLIHLWRGDPQAAVAKPTEEDAVKPAGKDGGLNENRNLSRSVVPITVPVRHAKREENPHPDAEQQDLPKKVA